MVQVLNILEVKRKPNLKEIITDCGNYYLSLDAVLTNNIRFEMSFSDEEWADIVLASDTRIGIEYSLDYLSRGMKSEKEVVEKLKLRNISGPAIELVMKRLRELQYIDDSKYAAEYVDTYKSSRGSIRLRSELILKGIDKNIINDMMIGNKEEQKFAILIAKKFTKDIVPFDRDKLMRFMLQRGYSYQIIREAISKLGGEVDDLSDL